MPLVNAKCPNCGGILQVDNEIRTAQCPYCGGAYIIENAIKKYITNKYTHVDCLHADVVELQDEKTLENRLRSGDTFIKLGDYASAKQIFTDMSKATPHRK